MARAKLAEEAEFVPTTVEQQRRLFRALVNQGTPTARARGIIAWLVTLYDDPGSGQLQTIYRRELARLEKPPWRGRPIRSKGALHGSSVAKLIPADETDESIEAEEAISAGTLFELLAAA